MTSVHKISPEHLAELYHVPLNEATIIHAVLGRGIRHEIEEISHETRLTREEITNIIFSNDSCETIQIIRQFVNL